MASLDRALARLVSVDHADAPLPLEIVRVIDEPRLERLAHFGVTEAGRRIARQLLRRIRDRSRLAPVRPTRRVGMAFKGQLDLFADGEAHAS